MGFFSELGNSLIEASHKERERRAARDNQANRAETAAGAETENSAPTMMNYTPQPSPERSRYITEIVVTDIDISFGSMVWLIIKFCFATIPAGIIVGIIYYCFYIGFLRSLTLYF